jgi:hypothetical protein
VEYSEGFIVLRLNTLEKAEFFFYGTNRMIDPEEAASGGHSFNEKAMTSLSFNFSRQPRRLSGKMHSRTAS